MANLMQKLFKNKSTQRLIVSFRTPQHQEHQLSKLSPSLIPQKTHHFSLTKPDFLNNPIFFLNLKSLENGRLTEPLKLYPNFPFAYLLNPVNSSGFDPLVSGEFEEGTAEAEDDDDDDARKVWADSVKKEEKEEDEQAQVQEAQEASEKKDIDFSMARISEGSCFISNDFLYIFKDFGIR